MTKNRNFGEVRVGTVVAFDGAKSIYRDIPYLITRKDYYSRNTSWFMQPRDCDKANDERWVGSTGWNPFGGYIISQPEAEAPMLYRHKKRGTTYTIIDKGKLQIEGPADMAEVVTYRDVDSGEVWTRPASEFFDGRFEVLPGSVEQPPALDEAAINNNAARAKRLLSIAETWFGGKIECKNMSPGGVLIAAMEAVKKRERDKALEDAARVCDVYFTSRGFPGHELVTAIRQMKGAEQPVARTDMDRVEWLSRKKEYTRAGHLVGLETDLTNLRAAIDAAMDKESGK
ncbi:hypothetical protein [Kozakia baliensis]|uniref:hypothetical protein n=1 Tax=Kozakia baliensis TaxID=153496 RepID=UPI000496AA0C|nr:hypothetical protein [Kozakia baliensis]